MDFNEFYQANKEDFNKVITLFGPIDDIEREPEIYRKEYDGERTRRARSVGMRAPKVIERDGQTVSVPVAQIIFGFPKKIVRAAVAFVCGGKMSVVGSQSDDALARFTDIWTNSMRMQFVIKNFIRTTMIETKAAIVFFPVKKEGDIEPLRLRSQILNWESGEFFPYFDEFGDMTAFFWKYQGQTEEGADAEMVRIWTAEREIRALNSGSGWEIEEQPNLFKKIPVVYAQQNSPEWETIVAQLDQLEGRISRLADTNDYFAEPMLKLYGEPMSLPEKDQVGKVVQFDVQTTVDNKTTSGDAQYLTWDQFPESIRLELETLWNGIFNMSSTPDMSLENLKGLGNAISGIALRTMFLDPIIKADDNREIYGPAIARMVSIVKAGIGEIIERKYNSALNENQITIDFGLPLPDDLKERVDVLVMASGNKPIVSQSTAVANSPFTKDAEEEYNLIQSEEDAAAERDQLPQIGSFQ